MSVCLETVLFSSIEVSIISSQLFSLLAKIKTANYHLYVYCIWRQHCQSMRKSSHAPCIFSYKSMSPLYYSMFQSQELWDNLLPIILLGSFVVQKPKFLDSIQRKRWFHWYFRVIASSFFRIHALRQFFSCFQSLWLYV